MLSKNINFIAITETGKNIFITKSKKSFFSVSQKVDIERYNCMGTINDVNNTTRKYLSPLLHTSLNIDIDGFYL